MRKIIIIGLTLISALYLVGCDNNQLDTSFDATKSITVYTRDTSSGTRTGFMNGIGFGDAAEDNSLLVSGFVTKDNTGILTAMKNDEYGIGFISLASLNNTVKGLAFNGVEPTIANVINNTYSLKRPFNYVIRADGDYGSLDKENLTKAFIAFLGTIDGSDIINDKGAIPLSATGTWDDIKAEHNVCLKDNSNIVIKFGGSDSIEKIAKALSSAFAPKCGGFIAEHDHTGSSDGFKRTQGSEKDSDNAKDVGFASRDFKDTEIGDIGTQGQLAWDAIVAIVNNRNTLNAITQESLKSIYDGTYKVWEDINQ
ncbi:hypothetical protein CI105_01175 [Candidatus Izimaplasma bacterium ZiA1]|uniref:substrate-binding domain-containing protein n=1 Tax=Candidatus Izimoplasma sp. ZiA1 TaxID=2024899 RepID=UPI000BAA8B91|nr:hypothetical protein CI105_01175 [Candidatus Izimaplasma bacterium ZiA1]